MTLDEVKEKFSQILGKAANDVSVEVSPRQGLPDFALSISTNEIRGVDSAMLSALMELGASCGMEVTVDPETSDSVIVALRKEPVALNF